MLVLSRKLNEVIVVGEGVNQVRIVIVDIRGDKCRVGIEAPKNVSVHRQEVHDAIERESAREKEKGREAA